MPKMNNDQQKIGATHISRLDHYEFHKLHKILSQLNSNIENIAEWIAPHLDKASSSFSRNIEKAVPKIQESVNDITPKISNVVNQATLKMHDRLDSALSGLSKGKEQIINDYSPRMAEKISRQTPRRLKNKSEILDALFAELGNNKRAVKRKIKSLAKNAKKADRQLQREIQKSENPHRGKNWFISSLIIGAVLFGLWKISQPVVDEELDEFSGEEDRWETPLN